MSDRIDVNENLFKSNIKLLDPPRRPVIVGELLHTRTWPGTDRLTVHLVPNGDMSNVYVLGSHTKILIQGQGDREMSIEALDHWLDQQEKVRVTLTLTPKGTGLRTVEAYFEEDQT